MMPFCLIITSLQTEGGSNRKTKLINKELHNFYSLTHFTIIKIILKHLQDIGCEGMNWIQLPQILAY
jgi:hypothetical protein